MTTSRENGQIRLCRLFLDPGPVRFESWESSDDSDDSAQTLSCLLSPRILESRLDSLTARSS